MVGTKACNGWEDKLVGLEFGLKAQCHAKKVNGCPLGNKFRHLCITGRFLPRYAPVHCARIPLFGII